MKRLLICDECRVSEVAPLCREIGVGIEVQAFYNPRVVENTPDAVEEHRKAIRGIHPVSVHGCFGDLCPGSFDSLVRQVARKRIEQSYAVAVGLDASHLVFHHGYIPHTSPPAGWIKRSTEFWLDFLAVKNAGIKVHLENLLELDPDLISDVVHSVGRDNLDINLDIGHAHCNSKTNVVEWIERLGVQIGYVHLHDNHGMNDEHLGLGQGTIPMKEVCQALNEYAPEAIWAVESKGEGLRQSLDWLSTNGFLKEG